MQVELRLFGALSERAGASRIEVEVPETATVADLRKAVADAYPSIAPMLERVSIAVDLEVARDEQPIGDASEFALLPPVAGGSGPVIITGLRTPPFEVDRTIAEVAGPDVGGTAVFLGTVRDHSPDVGEVTGLGYTAYSEMAEKVLADIADEIAVAHPEVAGIALLHAVGDLEIGDHTILIVCAAAHRAPAFEACREALEEAKNRVPVWKREMTADGGHRWVGLDTEDVTPPGGPPPRRP